MAAATASEITRRSVHLFLQHYRYFTLNSAILAFPFSLSVLLSQALIPHFLPLLPIIYARVRAIFDAAGFPPSYFFSLLTLKLSETISCSAITFLFTLSFLLLAKASVIRHLNSNSGATRPIISLYMPLFSTQCFSYFLVISANATSFFFLFIGFTTLEGPSMPSSPNWVLFLSASGALFYSIVLANTFVICNLASVITTTEEERLDGGLMAIAKACALIRGRASTALTLAVPVNLGLVGVEVLFQYRIVRPFYYQGERALGSFAMEAVLIAYLYSILVVLCVIIDYVFYVSCKDAVEETNEEGFYACDVEKLRAIEDFV